MTAKSISELLTRYELKQCTPEEEARVEAWFAEHGTEQIDFDQLSPEGQQQWVDQLYADIARSNWRGQKQSGKKPLWPKFAAAAAVLIGLCICLYTITYKSEKEKLIAYADHIQPAHGAATLKLANGKVLNLNDAKTGLVVDVAALTYVDGSAVASLPENSGIITEGAKVEDMVMFTPTGKQYNLVLSDGTKVWLNAASSLKFPSSFSKDGNRRVELTGEAYFEVAKDKARSFIVKSNTQEVEVLGTHFNINTYRTAVKTTLLEGSVKVMGVTKYNANNQEAVILKPNEQAVNSQGRFEVKNADGERDIAWKSGWFDFKSASLQDVLNDASKWYDLDISYEGEIPADRFTGRVPRTASLGTFIRLLQLSDVKFRLEGRKMIIT